MASIMQDNSAKSSYAQKAQQLQFPTREQAIVIDSIDGVSIQDYTVEIGKIVGPSKIRFVSRISHGRVCIYLDSKQTADKLTDNHVKIKLGAHSLVIRPLIVKSKRIILSNVCPIIPHSFILDELTKLNITPCSQISFIRAGINSPGYSHIMSFRRQMYIQPDDVAKLPEAMHLSYEDTVYWIYLSAEKLSCFLCKEEGHLAKFCKSNLSINPMSTCVTNSSDTASVTATQGHDQDAIANSSLAEMSKLPHGISLEHSVDSPTLQVLTPNSSANMPPPFTSMKRPSTSTASSMCSTQEVYNYEVGNSPRPVTVPLKKIKKKRKLSNNLDTSIEEISLLLLPAKEFILDNARKLPLDFTDCSKFPLDSYNNHKVLNSALKFTQDIPALIEMLSSILDFISERRLKSRIIRIVKRLNNLHSEEHSSEESSLYEDQEDTTR
ncbi:Transposon TX1 uncharacterized 82 kDa protein [Anthophora quadrimaculata]